MTRVGLAGIQQETNTFTLRATTYEDFASQCFLRNDAVLDELAETNTEIAGAARALRQSGAEVVPLLATWASPGGRLRADAFETLAVELEETVRTAMPLDGLVLALHGAMAVEGIDDGDGALIARMRTLLGECVIGVCLDLHANVTDQMQRHADALIGYHTYPHIDQQATGARIAELVLDQLAGRRLCTRMAKRAMLLPAETTSTTDGPMADLRRLADVRTQSPVRDVSLFVVQPWLDVPDLGFAVTVTSDAADGAAAALAEEIADEAWHRRAEFDVALVPPRDAIDLVRHSAERPVILTESADSTSAGAAGDSAAMLSALLGGASDLRALLTVVDPAAVAQCASAGVGASMSLRVGAGIDPRFSDPVALTGVVTHVDDGRFRLAGPVSTGLPVSSGRRAVVRHEQISVLLTEQSAYSYDPAAFRSAGLHPEAADLVIVRSACMFRAGYAEISTHAHVLDTPGASTPKFAALPYRFAPRPLYPIDRA